MADSNFAVLAGCLPDAAEIGRQAEAVFAADAHAAVAHLRRFGEALAIELESIHRLPPNDNQFDRLKQLRNRARLDEGALAWLHQLRTAGNRAVHGYHSLTTRDALAALKVAARLAAWYWRHFTTQEPPQPGAFVKPKARDARTDARLRRAEQEAERLAREMANAQAELERRLAMPEVAIHISLETAFQALEEAQQTVASSFLARFRATPLSEDWPLQALAGASDDKVRIVDADGLSFVVVQPERGDIVLVAYVATTRQQAERWSSTKRFEVNPALGTLQVFDPREAENAARGLAGGLFDVHDDETLVQVGVPRVLLPSVRALASDGDLDAFCPLLPPEASDALYLLACGYSLSQVRSHLDRKPIEATVDAADFAAAVHHPESRRSVLVLSGDEDLDAVLRGSVEAWRLFLHPDQRKLVQMHARGPVQVLGGAGTGKTVALLHRAAHLLQNYFVEPNERIVVTTFTKNLAADLQHHLAKLLTPADLDRVDVIHFHALARDLWSVHGDGRRLARSEDFERARSIAYSLDTLGFDQRFYDAEWSEVVQAQDLEEEADYLRARRPGRGTGLGRSQRRQVWRVMAGIRSQLDQMGLLEAVDQMRLLRSGLEIGRISRAYSSVLVDEAQDFGMAELKLLRGLVNAGDNDMFLVGDAHQRIYGLPAPMSACGIQIRGRSHRLRVNYRTTAKVMNWAVQALRDESFDDLDGGEDTLDGYRSLRVGVAPTVKRLGSRDEEIAFVIDQVRTWLMDGEAEAIGVACPANRLVDETLEVLSSSGIPAVRLQTDASQVGDGVRVGTFHRLKGLEFPRVLLTSVQEGWMPLRTSDFHGLDDDAKSTWDRRQRCLLYVAASRARDELVVTGSGRPSPFLRG